MMTNMKEKNFISAVVYVNNDEDNILKFLEKLKDILCENFEKYEIICVNDCSSDRSLDEIRKFSGSVISVVNMSRYHSLESSMKAGIDLAIGDFVYEFDSIFMDYNTSLIMDVYKQSLKGFDIVSAGPKDSKSSLSRAFYKLLSKNSGNLYNLQTENFRIISRRGINRVYSLSKSVPYRKALYASCGLNRYFFRYNPIIKNNHNYSKLHKSEKYNLATDSLILFTNVAYKMSLFMTSVFLISILLVVGYAIAVFFSQSPIEGWTTLMLFLSFSFFGIFAFFAVVIKYLSILINLVFKKEEYLIKSVEKIVK